MVGRDRDVRRLAKALSASPQFSDGDVRGLRRAHPGEQIGVAGSAVVSCQVTFSARAARTASHSFSATTPTKSPLRTMRAGMSLIEALVDRQRLGADPIGALAARPDHAAMQHAGHAHVLHVDVLAGRLVRDVDARHVGADHLVARDRLLRRRAGEFHVERLVAEQRAVGDRLRSDGRRSTRRPC